MRPIAKVVVMLAGSFSLSAHAVDLLQYFPTPEGAQWEYRYSDSLGGRACIGTRIVSVTSESFDQATLATAAPKSDECTGPVAAARPQFRESRETFTTNMSDYRLVERDITRTGEGGTLRWATPLLFMPTYSNVYQTYNSAGIVTEVTGAETRSAAYSAIVKVVGLEDVNVPAGKFKSTVHLQLIERRVYRTPVATRVVERTDRWLARGIGVVRIRVEVLVNDQRFASSQMQLLKASVPRGPLELQDQAPASP